MRCKIIINDEVNVKIEGLPVEIRRKIANKMKYEVPYARYLPQYKLGRWDGKVGFFGLGGNGYVNHLDTIINLLQESGVEIEQIDDKRAKVDLQFKEITQRSFVRRTKNYITRLSSRCGKQFFEGTTKPTRGCHRCG